MTKKTYQIQIALRGSKPKIWRRILVPSNLLLPDFHKIIQTTMGWTNSHLHQFIKNRIFYTRRMADDNVDYSKTKISDLLKKEKDRIIYEYDFGDSWEHEILVEEILPVEKDGHYPICLKGKRACPPEDCGGIWGYSDFLKAIEDINHPEHDDMLEWIGGGFDPEKFDIESINKKLKYIK